MFFAIRKWYCLAPAWLLSVLMVSAGVADDLDDEIVIIEPVDEGDFGGDEGSVGPFKCWAFSKAPETEICKPWAAQKGYQVKFCVTSPNQFDCSLATGIDVKSGKYDPPMKSLKGYNVVIKKAPCVIAYECEWNALTSVCFSGDKLGEDGPEIQRIERDNENKQVKCPDVRTPVPAQEEEPQ